MGWLVLLLEDVYGVASAAALEAASAINALIVAGTATFDAVVVILEGIGLSTEVAEIVAGCVMAAIAA